MIDPAHIEPLARHIVRLFTRDEVNRILLTATGDRLYDLAPRNLPDPETITTMLDRISASSSELAVLGAMLARRPADAEFAALAEQAAPGVGKAASGAQGNVAALVQGLDTVRTHLDDPAVSAALSTSRTGLRDIATTIDSLDAYKSLHELLHMFQYQQFGTLREAARHLPDNPTQLRELRAFRAQLRTACRVAREAAGRLPDTPLERRLQLIWIDDLEKAGEDFHEGVNDRNADEARRALNRIARIIRRTPDRLNAAIFSIATALPLENLAGSLEQVVASRGDASIAGALQALRIIIPAIRARVVEHKEWQDADMIIGELDDMVERAAPGLIEDFAPLWMELKALVLELAEREPEADWATGLKSEVADVDDSLAAEVADAGFQDSFRLFKDDAQHQFLEVDSRLKSDCTELVKLGEPLNGILTELGA